MRGREWPDRHDDDVVAKIRGSSALTTASAEIAASNTDLSQRTEEQAASLEETSASMEELTATVKQNAENAQQANKRLRPPRDVAIKGGQVVAEVVDPMDGIRHRPQDRRHHRCHRRDRVSDQHPGAERRRRGRTCR